MPEPLRVLLPVALSGRYAALGRQVRAGAECWAADANAAGGVRVAGGARRAVELTVIDDESDEQVLAARLEPLLAAHREDLLLGPYGSGLTLRAGALADAHGQVLFNHSGSADRIFAQGFRRHVGIISPASAYLAAVLDALHAADGEPRRVALFSVASGFGDDVAAGVIERVAHHGHTLVAHERYPPDRPDFSPSLQALARLNVDWLFGAGRVEDDLQLAAQLEEASVRCAAGALVVAGIERFGATRGPAADGWLGPSQWEPGVWTAPDIGPSGDAFLARYRQLAGATPDYPAIQGYAGGLVAQACAERAASLAPDDLYAAAAALECTTFYGPFAIDPASGRQRAHRVLAVQWEGGRRVVVWPRARARARVRYPAWPLVGQPGRSS